MKKVIKNAFTLIELLVVIAIIGILSGLIVVSMGGMTQKANIAKAQIFSNSLRNSLMANLVSEWKFDQINNPGVNQTPDTWRLGNSGTLNGSAGTQNLPQLQTSGCVLGNCLLFDGTDDYVDVGDPTNGSLDFGTNDFSISFWFKSTLADRGIISKKSAISDVSAGWVIYLDSPGWHLRARLADGSNELAVSGLTANLNDNIWHHGLIVKARDTLSIYVNGAIDNSITGVGSYNVNNVTSLFIGRVAATYFSGALDDIRIFNAAPSTSQIKEQYYVGLNNLLDSGEISQGDYTKRLSLFAINN